jgi:hypothetical protein
VSRSELQREYTLQDAISALISFDNDMPAGEQAAGWLVKTMAELEAKAEAAAKVERIVVAEVRPGDTVIVTLREHLDVSMHEWSELQRAFTTQFRQVTGILDLRVVVLVDGAGMSVLRVAPETTESDQGVTTQLACPSVYTGPQGRLECDRKVLHSGNHMASLPLRGDAFDGGVVGWDDAEQDGARCPITAPKPCVLEIRHPGNHRSNSGTEWPNPPSLLSRPSTIRRAPDPSESVTPDQWHQTHTDIEDGKWRQAPDHQPDARPAKDGEVVCARENRVTPTRPYPSCTLPKWHDGPHMDAMAIAHAGKAGEVWE